MRTLIFKVLVSYCIKSVLFRVLSRFQRSVPCSRTGEQDLTCAVS